MIKNKPEEVKVRLLRPHYHNSIKREKGSVIRLPKFSADWLVKRGSARVEPSRK